MNELSEYQQRILQRNLKVIQAIQAGIPKADVATAHQLGRRSVYYIWNRFQDGSIYALIPDSKAPKTVPEYDTRIIEVILMIRDQYGYGAQKIHDMITMNRQTYGLEEIRLPCARTIHALLKAHDRILPRKKTASRRKQVPDHYQLRDQRHPGRILEADMKTDHYLQEEPLIINGLIDITSRVVSVRESSSAGTLDAARLLVDHIYEYGIPQILKTDNDMAYLGQVKGTSIGLYTRLCLYLGIHQVAVPVRRPRWKPFIERFFRTWDKDFFNKQIFTCREQFHQCHLDYQHQYNRIRPHEGLKKSLCNPDKVWIPDQYHYCYTTIRKPTIKKERLIELLEKKSIPISKGVFSFIRFLPKSGVIDFKGNHFQLSNEYQGKMIKGTIRIIPEEQSYPVDFYFKDQGIMSDTYRHKPYKIKSL